MYTDLHTLKEHLRIDVDVEDNYLMQIIKPALMVKHRIF